MHKVVEYYLRRRVVGNYTPLDDLLAVYDRAWAGEDIIHDRPGSHEPAEGFLTREHEEARKAAGREALRRFWNHEEAEGTKPTLDRERIRLRARRPTACAGVTTGWTKISWAR